MATRNYGVLWFFVFAFIVLLIPVRAIAGSTATTTAVTSPSSTITVGDTVTFTATVTAASGTPTGLVTFFDGSTLLGGATLNGVLGNDQATFSTSLLSQAGTNPPPHSITAVYNGDATFASSTSSAFLQKVQRRVITTTLALNPTTVVVGQPSTTTVTVTDAGLSFPPGTANVFAATGAPATGRTGFTATLFADGQVLVAGGTDKNGAFLQSAEIYSVSGAAFSATGDLNTARTGAVAVLLPNGKVLVAGGSSDGTANGALDTAELFDPTGNSGAGSFTLAGSNSSNPNHMASARFGHFATLLPTGQVLLAGGENSGGVLSSAELYNPATDTFTPSGNLGTARTGAVAILLRTSAVLVAGGSSDGTVDGALDSAELFSVDNTGAGTSLAITSKLSEPRWQAAITLLPGASFDNALIVGGRNSTGVLTSGDVYNIRVFPGSFHAVANQMAVGRAGGSAVALPNAEVLLAGGSVGQVAELYDFGSNKFEATGDLVQSDNSLAGVLLNNGQVLMVGLTSGTAASDADLYSPAFPPLGQVNFSSTVSGDTFGETCVLVPGGSNASTCSSTVTPAGSANPDIISAMYQTDSVHIANANGTANLLVNQAATVTHVFVTNTPTPFGQPIGFSAVVNVSSPGSTANPTGAVQFAVDGINVGAPVPLFVVAPGNSEADTPATLVLPVSGSPHTVTANYVNSDGNFINSSDSFNGVTITPAVTATAVVSSQNPSSFGQAVTFTAIVQDTSGFSTAVPSGAVQFAVDGVNFGSPVTLTGVSATSSTAVSPIDSALTISGSPHTVTASYVNADGNFVNSNGSLSPGQSVTQAATAVAVASSAITAKIGDTVTFTATVTNSGTGTPTGLVTFFDGPSPLGSSTLNGVSGNDQATFSTSVLNAPPFPSNRSITAIYDGDANFIASPRSPAITELLQPRNTTTNLMVNPTTVFVGQPVTATVTVTDTGTSAPPGTPDSFSITGAPATGRTGFTITSFSDSQVLIAGGTDVNGNVLNSAEIYGLSGAAFAAAKSNLNTARTGAVAVLLPNGKVLVAGGSSDGTVNGALATAELFDPLSETFTPTSHDMVAARFAAMVVLLVNGQVLIAGGEGPGGVLNSAELYDPVSDTFFATGSMNVARTGAAALSLRFEGVLIAGGSSDGTANGALDSLEVFGFNSAGVGGFRPLSSLHLSAPRWQPEAAVVQGFSSFALIAGGKNSTGTLTSGDRFNGLTASSIEQVSNQMVVGRANGSAVELSNGRTLLVGGASAQITELYDFAANRFEAAGDLLQSNIGFVGTLLDNGQVLAVGLTAAAIPASEAPAAELYTPSFIPLGSVPLSSSELGDGLSGFCILLPTSTTTAACTTNLTPVSVGTNPHVVTANVTTSSASASVTVNTAATSTGVISSVNPSVFGEPVTFTATVTDISPGSATPPTGTVQFGVDGANFGAPVTLIPTTAGSSTAMLTVSALGVSGSPHSVVANYLNADSSFTGSNGVLSGDQTVTPASTSTGVVSSVPSPTYGQGVTFTATISNTGSGSTAAPTGFVQFVVDGQNFGAPVPLTAGTNTSSATSTVASLTVNGGSPHIVKANYLTVDSNFIGSSGSLSGGLHVNPAHLTVTANSLAVVYDGATFTGFSAVLSGFVNGETETSLRSSGALAGTAGFTGPAVIAVNAGQYTINPTQGTLAAANYDFPAANFVAATLIVVKANAKSAINTLTTPVNDPVNGGTLSFVVVVTSTTGGTPTGSVQGTDDANSNLTTVLPLSMATCPSGTPATASCAKFSPAAGQLPTGPQTITASYQGDANFNSTSTGSTPSSVEVTVESAINTTPGATIPPQQISFENGPALAGQNLTLSCTVQAANIPSSPQFPICTLSSTSLTPSGSVTVNLSTVAPTTAGIAGAPSIVASGRVKSARPYLLSAAFGLPIGFMGLILITGSRSSKRSSRRARICFVLTSMLSILLMVIGCGGHSTPPQTVGGTPSGTYLVSVVGADSNHNQVVVATIPLNVH